MKRGSTLAAALTMLVAAGAAHDAAAQTTLRFGKIPSTVRNVGSLYLHVAERKGYFAREGIKLESVLIEGGTDRMVAAFMGEAGALPSPLPTVDRFVDLQYLAAAGVR